MAEIASAVIDSLQWLTRLSHSEDLAKHESEVPQPLWDDELGRLRVWAANIGAHQTGPSSLDFRLRDSSHVRQTVLRVLERLTRTIKDLEDAVEGSDVGDESTSDFSDSDNENDGRTEIQSIYYSLRDCVTSLFQLSMTIRQPGQYDRLLGTKKCDAAIFEPFDRDHVLNKFPTADAAILNRLGHAISQRRAILRYRERHHAKLTRGISRTFTDQGDTNSVPISETVATEFMERLGAEPSNDDNKTVASQTSYAPSIVRGSGRISIPPAPEGSEDGNPFECPYCFCIVSIPSTVGWARHIFNDLMPYICIFSDCTTPRRLYHSRREWFYHLNTQHSATMRSNSKIECALCQSSVANDKSLERHLGRHLEELALFALPQIDTDIDPDELDLSDFSASSKEEDIENLAYEYGASPVLGAGHGSSQQKDDASDGASLVDGSTHKQPATHPERSDEIQWLAFNISRGHIIKKHTVRCDIDSVEVDTLSKDFRLLNCIHGNASSSHELETNAVGWALADLNPSLRENPLLLKHAVSCFRQARSTPLSSRRRIISAEGVQLDPPQDTMDGELSGPTAGEARKDAFRAHGGPRHAEEPVEYDADGDTSDEDLRNYRKYFQRDRRTNPRKSARDGDISHRQPRHSRSSSGERETTSEFSRSERLVEYQGTFTPPTKQDVPSKGILKPSRASFPEETVPIREGVAPRDLNGIPPNARWTKIARKLVNPAALEAGRERFEGTSDYVMVLRVLSKEEIQMYTVKTEEIRAMTLALALSASAEKVAPTYYNATYLVGQDYELAGKGLIVTQPKTSSKLIKYDPKKVQTDKPIPCHALIPDKSATVDPANKSCSGAFLCDDGGYWSARGEHPSYRCRIAPGAKRTISRCNSNNIGAIPKCDENFDPIPGTEDQKVEQHAQYWTDLTIGWKALVTLKSYKNLFLEKHIRNSKEEEEAPPTEIPCEELLVHSSGAVDTEIGCYQELSCNNKGSIWKYDTIFCRISKGLL